MEEPPPADAGLLVWADDLAQGHREMDATHREFIGYVNAMLAADDASFDSHLDAFADHAHRHFADEDRWMAESDWENARCHVDEHAAVLTSVAEVRALPAARRLEVGRRLAVELARWFPGHVKVMDEGLARHLLARRLGGARVSLRRPDHS